MKAISYSSNSAAAVNFHRRGVIYACMSTMLATSYMQALIVLCCHWLQRLTSAEDATRLCNLINIIYVCGVFTNFSLM